MRIIIYLFILCAMPVVGFGQTVQSVFVEKSCDDRYFEYKSLLAPGYYQQAYDLIKEYVETCTFHDKILSAFSMIPDANQERNTDLKRYEECRDWLKGVLYLNPDSQYYCSDVQAILSTFYWFDDAHGRHFNGSNAVIKYLLESNKCLFGREWLITVYEGNRQAQLEKWRDTVQDSIATPIDTTLPSLEDLDLGILRGPTGSVAATSNEPHLGELIATRNPFTDILELKYRLDKSAMVRIDVYDLLGRAVYSEGQGYKTEGEHVLSLQSKSWSSGSYYVRLSSPSGEVKTVKVVKE